jgi:hypothetical protein
MVEAMVALTLVDALMAQTAQCNLMDGVAGVAGNESNPLGKLGRREGWVKGQAAGTASDDAVALYVDEE